jgi:hypothetical protein
MKDLKDFVFNSTALNISEKTLRLYVKEVHKLVYKKMRSLPALANRVKQKALR